MTKINQLGMETKQEPAENQQHDKVNNVWEKENYGQRERERVLFHWSI